MEVGLNQYIFYDNRTPNYNITDTHLQQRLPNGATKTKNDYTFKDEFPNAERKEAEMFPLVERTNYPQYQFIKDKSSPAAEFAKGFLEGAEKYAIAKAVGDILGDNGNTIFATDRDLQTIKNTERQEREIRERNTVPNFGVPPADEFQDAKNEFDKKAKELELKIDEVKRQREKGKQPAEVSNKVKDESAFVSVSNEPSPTSSTSSKSSTETAIHVGGAKGTSSVVSSLSSSSNILSALSETTKASSSRSKPLASPVATPKAIDLRKLMEARSPKEFTKITVKEIDEIAQKYNVKIPPKLTKLKRLDYVIEALKNE
jgi:hypothetical protein